ncbi:hypothetical protein EMIT0P395_10326 [Pseudomonas sp. IT-P395]
MLVRVSTLFLDLKQVCDESDCFDGGVCVGGVDHAGASEYCGVEFRGAVRFSRQSAACRRGHVGVCVAAGADGAGLA